MADSQTPEQARDQTIAAIIAAGGVVTGTVPMATPDQPGVIVAYQIQVTIPTPAVAAAVQAIQTQTATTLTGLIPWVDPTLPAEGSGS